MAITIRVTGDVRDRLNEMKLHRRESYNDVILRLFEDLTELNEETLKDIQKARKEIDSGKTRTQDEVKIETGL
jgi:predicted CopG family antitoxin